VRLACSQKNFQCIKVEIMDYKKRPSDKKYDCRPAHKKDFQGLQEQGLRSRGATASLLKKTFQCMKEE